MLLLCCCFNFAIKIGSRKIIRDGKQINKIFLVLINIFWRVILNCVLQYSTTAEGNLPERQTAAAVAALVHGRGGALQIHIIQWKCQEHAHGAGQPVLQRVPAGGEPEVGVRGRRAAAGGGAAGGRRRRRHLQHSARGGSVAAPAQSRFVLSTQPSLINTFAPLFHKG